MWCSQFGDLAIGAANDGLLHPGAVLLSDGSQALAYGSLARWLEQPTSTHSSDQVSMKRCAT
ncbi:hypothetical protein LBMAG49_28730 [Planctomycetota bacterium]|nr:hypothetical protein LBMAG49_28730 [Planctomycetota bacterium]